MVTGAVDLNLMGTRLPIVRIEMLANINKVHLVVDMVYPPEVTVEVAEQVCLLADTVLSLIDTEVALDIVMKEMAVDLVICFLPLLIVILLVVTELHLVKH